MGQVSLNALDGHSCATRDIGVAVRKQSMQFQLVFVVLKSFVASAIMYLPRVWVNGGLAAAPIILCTTCSMSILCCRKLVSCADVMIQSNGGGHVPSYGDISRV